jgi:hypothetical protein
MPAPVELAAYSFIPFATVRDLNWWSNPSKASAAAHTSNASSMESCACPVAQLVPAFLLILLFIADPTDKAWVHYLLITRFLESSKLVEGSFSAPPNP